MFRVHFPDFGTDHRVVFDRELKEGPAKRMFLDGMSFERQPDLCNPRPWLTGLPAGCGLGGAGGPQRPAPSPGRAAAATGRQLVAGSGRTPGADACGGLDTVAYFNMLAAPSKTLIWFKSRNTSHSSMKRTSSTH